MQSNDADSEGKGLSAVSMTQEYSWLGLGSSDEVSGKPAAAAASASVGGFFLQDLILWNVLGFTLDVDNYLNLCLVCTEWNRMVKLREPPVMMKITRLLLKNNEENKPISAEKIELLTTVFAMLQDRECALYRKSPPPQDDHQPQGLDSSSATACCWPSIQPHFNVLLMKFSYDLCTQRGPHNYRYSALLYRATTGFLDQLAVGTTEKLWPTSTPITSIDRNSSSGSDSNNDPFVELQRVVDVYNAWEGTMDAVEGIVGYLNRFYIKNHSLLTIREHAYNSGASSISTTKLVDLFQRLEQAVVETTTGSAGSSDGPSSLCTWNTAENRSLLLRASRIAQTISSMWTSTKLSTRQEDFTDITEAYRKLLTAFEALLERAAEEEKISQQQAQQHPAAVSEKPVTIVSPEGQRFSLSRSSKFVQESGLLRRMRLQPGDVVKLLAVKTAWIQQALVFDSIERPFPGILMPLNRPMREIVGDDYTEFVTSMENMGLLGLVTFAHLLEWQNLLDLCYFELAQRMRGMPAAQLRALFAVQDN